EVRPRTVETAVHLECGFRERLLGVLLPAACREQAVPSEDAEGIGLCDGSGDVLPSAEVVLRDGQLRAGILRVDLRLHAREEPERLVPVGQAVPRYPGVLDVAGIPEGAGGLHASGHDLR